MPNDDKLLIELKLNKTGQHQVRIKSTRPVHASKVFAGKTVSESLTLLPLLFSICSIAQSCAGVRACEHALSISPAVDIERTRDALVRMETLREHLWHLFLDWPQVLQSNADHKTMAEVVAIQRAYQETLLNHNNVFTPGVVQCRPEWYNLQTTMTRLSSLLQQQVFSCSVDEWLAIDNFQQLQGWSQGSASIAARIVNKIIKRDLLESGRCEISTLPELTGQQWNTLMQEERMLEQPQWRGQCFETGILSRVDSPLLRTLIPAYGNGLLVRIVARLTEIAQLSKTILPDAWPELTLSAEDAIQSTGIGQACAARGQLVHRVVINNDSISSYQILAPTEWNFHPHGVVSKALAHLQTRPDNIGQAYINSIKEQAQLIIDAIDPCVTYNLLIKT